MLLPSKGKPKRKGVKKHKDPLAVKHKEFLYLLSKANNKKRRINLIDAADSKEIRAVSECIHNILSGNVSVTKKQIDNLRRYRHALRTLSSRCFPMKKKKEILKQKGGFLGALLPIALSAVGGLLPKIFG